MTDWKASLDEHAHFRELAAAATCGSLTAEESELLARHLRECEDCDSVYREYRMLTSEGVALLAPNYPHREQTAGWNEAAARRRLLVSLQKTPKLKNGESVRWRRLASRTAIPAAFAASLVTGIGIGAWQFGNRQGSSRAEPSLHDGWSALLSARQSAESALALKTVEVVRLQSEETAKRVEIGELQERIQSSEKRVAADQVLLKDLSQASARSDAQLAQVTQERDQLSAQLRDARQAYAQAQADFDRLRAERDNAQSELASVDAHISALTALNQEQEKRLKSEEQYLASDRDIRDLMSARNLYIADVFDVDGRSRTRKPFGRVFFTRGKSLLFYAYDLDQQPQIKNVTYQVWGQKEADLNQAALAVDLGILYLDSEPSRRWFMRFDEPRTLSEIDSVFVTVEPHGGSRRPTGKPFLFATLRTEPNHP